MAATQESVLDQEKDRQHTPTPPRAALPLCKVGATRRTTLGYGVPLHRPLRIAWSVAASYQIEAPLLCFRDTTLARAPSKPASPSWRRPPSAVMITGTNFADGMEA